MAATQLGSCLGSAPQGSALGSLLLLIYVNDISLKLLAARVCVAIIMLISMMNCLICCVSTQSVISPPIYVECVDIQKYLDLNIDYKLSWRGHVMSICKKMAYYLASYNYLIGYIIKILYLKVLLIKVQVAYLVMTHLNIYFLYGVSH